MYMVSSGYFCLGETRLKVRKFFCSRKISIGHMRYKTGNVSFSALSFFIGREYFFALAEAVFSAQRGGIN